MQLDMNQPIISYSGEAVKDGTKEVTMQSVVFLAMNNLQPGVNPTGDEKLRRHRISIAAFDKCGKLDLDLADAAFLMEQSGIANGPLLHGRLCEAIEEATRGPIADAVTELVEESDDDRGLSNGHWPAETGDTLKTKELVE